MSADPFLVALARFTAARQILHAVGQALERAEALHGMGVHHPVPAAVVADEAEAVREDVATLSAAITTAPTTADGARALLALAARERANLEPEDLAAACENARAFIGQDAAAAPAAAVEPQQMSATFAALHEERLRLRRAAEMAAEAVIAGDTDADPRERAAQDRLADLWAADDRMMATPAERPADLAVKAAFLAEQWRDFKDIERRYAGAVIRDLCRLFPLPAEEGARP